MVDLCSDKFAPLRRFLGAMTELAEAAHGDHDLMLDNGSALLSSLVADDGWLPDEFAEPDPRFYRQYLLYCDPLERFSVVSFVWGPGQKTPVHDHTVWGLVGVLRGAEVEQRFTLADGRLRAGASERLQAGEVARLSPTDGDIHQVSNAYDDRPSVSIHVYGADIGRVSRHTFDHETAKQKEFVSGYANATLPNAWGTA